MNVGCSKERLLGTIGNNMLKEEHKKYLTVKKMDLVMLELRMWLGTVVNSDKLSVKLLVIITETMSSTVS